SNVMRAGRQLEMVEIAAEVFDETDVGSIDEHLSAPGIDVQLHAANRRAFERWLVRPGRRIARIERDGKPGAPRPEGKPSEGEEGALPDEWRRKKRRRADIRRRRDEFHCRSETRPCGGS